MLVFTQTLDEGQNYERVLRIIFDLTVPTFGNM